MGKTVAKTEVQEPVVPTEITITPSGEGPAVEPGSEMVDVGGIQVPKEIAEYLGPLVEQFTGQITQLQGELARAQANMKPASVKEPVKEETDYETLLFTDPKGAIQKLREEIKAEVTGEIKTQQNNIEMEKQFWTMFYGDYPELKEDDFVVKAILQRDFQKLQNLTNDEAMKKIAAESKKVLLRNRETKTGDGSGVVLEGSGGVRKQVKEEPAVKPEAVSITSLLRERRNARVKTGA